MKTPLMSQEDIRDSTSDIDQILGSPTSEEIREIVEAGMLAPSADNTQPWRFKWDQKSLKIYLLVEIADTFCDTRNSASWITLGSVLTNIEIASLKFGYVPKWALFPKDVEENLVADITFEFTQGAQDPLHSSLESRCTNRRPYQLEALSHELKLEFGSIFDNNGNCSLEIVEERSALAKVASLAASFDQIFFRNRLIHEYLFRWLRFSAEEIERTRDGLPLASLEANIFDQFSIRLARSWTWSKMMAKLGLDKIVVQRARKAYLQSGAFGLITVEGSRPEDFVRGGMLFQRLWLTATLHGLSLQPTTGILFMELKSRFDPATLSPDETKHIEAVGRDMESVLPSFTQRTPIMLFRLGKSAPPTARSLRRYVKDILTIKSE